MENGKNLYAILVNGRHGSGDLRNIYYDLGMAGLSPDRIIALDGNPAGGLRGDIAKAATLKNLDRAFAFIRTTASSLDRLLLNFSAHGQVINGESCLFLQDNVILSESELEKMIEDLGVGQIIMYFSNCYGGGFSERLGKGNNIAISACTRKEQATENRDTGQGDFTSLLYPGLLQPPNTVGSAFDRAAKKLKKSMDPNWFYPPIDFSPQMCWQNVNPWDVVLY